MAGPTAMAEKRVARPGFGAGVALGMWLLATCAGAGDAPRWVVSLDALPNFHFLGDALPLPITVYDARDPYPPAPNPAERNRGRMPASGPRGNPVRLAVFARPDRTDDPGTYKDGESTPADDATDLIAVVQAMPYGRERPTLVPFGWLASRLADASNRLEGRVNSIRIHVRLAPENDAPTGGEPLVAAAAIHLWDLGRTPPDGAGADAALRFMDRMSPHFDRIGVMPEDTVSREIYGFAAPERVVWLIPRRSEDAARRWGVPRLIRDTVMRPRVWRYRPAVFLGPVDAGYLDNTDDLYIHPVWTRREKLSEKALEHDSPPVLKLFRDAVRWRIEREGEFARYAANEPSGREKPIREATLILFPGGTDVTYGTGPFEFKLALEAALAAFEYAPGAPERLILASPPPMPGHETARDSYATATREVARDRFIRWCSLVDEATPADSVDVSGVQTRLIAAADAAESPWPLVGAVGTLAVMGLCSFGVFWLWRRARWDRVQRRAR